MSVTDPRNDTARCVFARSLTHGNDALVTVTFDRYLYGSFRGIYE